VLNPQSLPYRLSNFYQRTSQNTISQALTPVVSRILRKILTVEMSLSIDLTVVVVESLEATPRLLNFDRFRIKRKGPSDEDFSLEILLGSCLSLFFLTFLLNCSPLPHSFCT
jgi:hypothetical protein